MAASWDLPHGETHTFTRVCPVLESLAGDRIQGGLLAGRVSWDTALDKRLYRGIAVTNERIVGQTYTATVHNGSFPFATDITVTTTITCEYTVIEF